MSTMSRSARCEMCRRRGNVVESFHLIRFVFRILEELLCDTAVESLFSREMHRSPWRRRSYVQGKWFIGALKEGTRHGGSPRMKSYAISL